MATKKYKLPLEVGFAALCDHIKTIRKTAESSGSAVADLAEAVSIVVEEIESILNQKQDLREPVSFVIPTSGWSTDNTVPAFPNCYDVEVEGLTAKNIVSVTAAPNSVLAARAANFTTVQTYAGYFRIRCEKIPTAVITAEYYIEDAEINEDDLSVGMTR